MKRYYPFLNVLIIPTDFCNMKCKYCFHNEYHSGNQKMTFETLEKIMKITLPYYKRVNFIWHGGEPLSMGLDFYYKVLDFQKKFNTNNALIKNQMQSNLTLMNEEIAEFIIKNGFGIGGSYDGIKNDLIRGNSRKILKGYNILKSKNKSCGMIQVVSNINVNYLTDSYEDFKKRHINYTINMYIKTEDNENSNELKLSSGVFINRVNELFDYWLRDKDSNIKIGYFMLIIDYILNANKTVCSFTSCLGKWLAIRPDGEIVPCNRFFPEEYTYGNVNDYDDIAQAFQSKGFENLLIKSITRREACKNCEIFDFCSGGCNNVALNENGIEKNGGISCKALKGIFRHIKEQLNKIQNLKEDDLDGIHPYVSRMIKNKKKTKTI